MKNIAYLRVSTVKQDTEKNKADILIMVNERGWGRVEFVEEKVSGKKSWRERKLKDVIDQLEAGDRLLVPELSRLGRSSFEIMEIIKIVRERGAALYAVKGGWEINGTMQSKIITMVMAMMAEVERDLISERTTEALRACRRKAEESGGVFKIGRPKGPGRSKLDAHRVEIEALLNNGSTKRFIAGRYSCTVQNLTNWMRKNKIGPGAE